MMAKKISKNRVGKAIFGMFFGIIMMMAGVMPALNAGSVYAEPETVVEALNNGDVTGDEIEKAVEEAEDDSGSTGADSGATKTNEKTCKESLGAIGWFVCPATGAISKAVDWLYDKIQHILVINPVEMKDGSPVYEIWKYMRGITNVLFIVFLMVMVYSQITGLGITNYGLKKTLPKLIVGAILVNLSFVFCSLAVDASNVIGNGLRGLFEGIEETTLANMSVSGVSHVTMAEMYQSLAGGSALAVGAGVVAFEAGAIWMLIPTALGALAAVVIGLVTIALRQAVVTILIMIAPLAVVAYILPNTEQWFRKWKDLLTRMLVFYPMFSLLFGASSLAGFAIIMSATSGFSLLLGAAVQIFPLIFAWKMMSMSGTFLSGINAKLTAMAAKPLATNRAWAESRRELTRQRHLASNNVYTPSLRLAQFLSDRKVMRGEETAEHATTVKNRGLAYSARRNYKRGNVYGAPSREGEAAYEAQARNARYQQVILRHKNNMNKGFGEYAELGTAQRARLDALDDITVKSFDALKMEQARGEKIDYDNAAGFYKRMEAAQNAHLDKENWDDTEYKRHFASRTSDEFKSAMERYNTIDKILEGHDVINGKVNLDNVHYASAYAAHAYDAQAKAVATKYQKYFDLLPPTKNVEHRLAELTLSENASELMDAIIPGLRVLNMRGDTDLVREQMQNILKTKIDEAGNVTGGIQLGTHASQALAGFLMFEVKDNDPWLRRFGKYINLETANVYNKNKRKKMNVDYEEYVKGYYFNPGDEETVENRKYPKKAMKELMEGTSLDGIERTAVDNYINSVMDAYSDENGVIPPEDYKAFENKLNDVNNATAPQLISAMRKTLSGSEPLVSMVKDVTGYEKKQKDDGTYELRSIFDDPKIQKRFGSQLDEYKKYRKKWAKTYLKSLLPSQVLSMRTDELQAYDKLLPEWYAEEHGDLHEALSAKIAEEYGDLSEDERASLQHAIESREMFRQCIDMGVLEQISRTNARRGVLDSKPMLRGFLGLDGDDGHSSSGLSKYIADKKGASTKMDGPLGTKEAEEEAEIERIMKELALIHRQREEAKKSGDASSKVPSRTGVFSEEDIARFHDGIAEIGRKYLEDKSNVTGYYEDTFKYVSENIPAIKNEYKDFYDKHEDVTINALIDELYRLISEL